VGILLSLQIAVNVANLIIRPATPADVETISSFIKGLAAFNTNLMPAKATTDDLLATDLGRSLS
jgi:hypothetical protein